MNVPLASIRIADLTRPRGSGEPVNIHVVKKVEEPRPDFAAMQRIIEQKIDLPPGTQKTARDNPR